MFVMLVHSEYRANLSKILPSRQGLVKTSPEEGMCSDHCEELPSSSPALQHVVQYTSNSGFLQHAACKTQTPGTTLAGQRSCALSLLWEAGSHMGSTSLAVLTYHPFNSFNSSGVREKGLAPAKSTFHTPCWMCREPFFTVGTPTSCQDCTSLPCA